MCEAEAAIIVDYHNYARYRLRSVNVRPYNLYV